MLSNREKSHICYRNIGKIHNQIAPKLFRILGPPIIFPLVQYKINRLSKRHGDPLISNFGACMLYDVGL